MPMLSSAELTLIRADVVNMLPDTGAILSATQVSDGQGGYTETWGTATASVSYRLDPIRGEESEAGVAIQPFQRFMLTLAHDQTITTAQRFEGSDGTQYSVIGEDSEKSWKISTRVIVERI